MKFPCNTVSPKKQFAPSWVCRFFIGVIPRRKPVEPPVPIIEEVSFSDFFSVEGLPNPLLIINPFDPA